MAVVAQRDPNNVEGKLYVASLPGDIDEDEIRKIFGLYGKLEEVYINRPTEGRSDRSAFVRYEEPSDCMAAMLVLSEMYKFRQDASVPIAISPARPRDSYTKGDGKGYKGGDYKGGSSDAGYGGTVVGGGSYHGWTSEPAAWDVNSTPLGGANATPLGGGGGGCGGGAAGAWPTSSPAATSGSGGGGGGTASVVPPPTPPPPAAMTVPPPAPAAVAAAGGGSGYGPAGGTREPGAKLWVGNLPADINNDSLSQVFGQYGRVVEVNILPSKSRSGQLCAFVNYASAHEADACLRVMHSGFELRPGEGELKVERPSDRPKGAGKGKGYPGYSMGKGGCKGYYKPY